MIRICTPQDTDAVLAIWLSASIQAHDFIEAAFWSSQVDAMRTLYLPASEVYVFERDAVVVGFHALHGDNLAALFVAPAFQGQGIGSQLIAHAKRQRTVLSLSVYQENQASYRFYLAQGFGVVSEQTDQHTGHREYRMRTGSR